jgi:hypothetical protein
MTKYINSTNNTSTISKSETVNTLVPNITVTTTNTPSTFMSRKEKFYVKFCGYMGIKLFKKYWPVDGSYWNKYHTDSKSTQDLNNIIDDANRYTRKHVYSSVLQMASAPIMYIMSIAHCPNNVKRINMAYICLGSFFLITQGYAFMVHHYNRIVARNTIKLLDAENVPDSNVPDSNVPDSNVDTFSNLSDDIPNSNDAYSDILYVAMISMIQNKCYYCVKTRSYDGWEKVSPIFETELEANTFKNFIYEKCNNDPHILSELIFLEKYKNLYTEWKQSKYADQIKDGCE